MEQYKVEQMPNFNHAIHAYSWQRSQKMNAELINIKSVDIQVKDIMQMRYAHRPRLTGLYTQLNFVRANLIEKYSDDDYINISMHEKVDEYLIFEILNAKWLLKLEDLENKTEEELEYEKCLLQNKIEDRKKSVSPFNTYYSSHNIKLLEYKLSCLEDYIFQRTNKQQANKILVKKLPDPFNTKEK